MKLRIFLAIIFASIATHALAVAPVVAKYSVANVETMKRNNLASKTSIHLDRFYDGLEGGDGDLVYVGTSCAEDLALYFKDGANNCFKRTDFGKNGVADARQCGVKGIGLAFDDTAALLRCLTLASQLSIPTVFTGGGQVNATADIIVAPHVELSCGLGNPDTVFAGSNFTLAGGLTHVIVHPSTTTIKPSDDGNAAFKHCLVEQSDGPYAPATFVPTTLRGSLNEIAGFAGDAVTNGAQSFTVENVYALGFANCFKSVLGNGRGRWFASGGHCERGMNLSNNGDVLPVETMNFMPFLTRHNGNATSMQWQIDKVFNDGSGRYRVVVEIPTTDIVVIAGDQVAYQSPINDGVQSATGMWLAGTPAVISSGTHGCVVATCQEFTLLGANGAPDSQDTQPSDGTAISLAATWTLGAPLNAITVAGDMKNISVGQAVAQTGGCGAVSGGTTVADVWPAQHTLFLSAALTCGSSGTLTFADTNFVFDGSGNGRQSLVMSAVHNNGECIVFTNVSGFKAINVHCFGHSIAYHCGDQSGNYSIVNADTGSDEKYFDQSVIGFLADGLHTGSDCSGGTLTGGILTQHATVGIKIDSDANNGKANFSFQSVSDGPSTGKIVGTILDVEAGTVLFNGNFGSTRGNIFVSGGTTYRNLYPPDNTDASTGYQVGNVLTGNDPGCTTQPQVTVTVVRPSGKLRTDGLTQTRLGVCSPWPASFTGSTLTCANGTGTGCGSGAVLTTDGLIPADLTMNGSNFPQADLYIQDQATADTHVRGCGNTPMLTAAYSPVGPCIGGAASAAPVTVASVAALRAGHFRALKTIYLAGWYVAGDGGEGALTNTGTNCTDDGGLNFKDADLYCFHRKTAGEIASSLWFGMKPDWSTDAAALLASAQTAMLAQNLHVLRMDCNAVGCGYNFSSLATVQPLITIDCAGSPYSQPANNDFRNYPHALVTTFAGFKFLGADGWRGNCVFIRNLLATAAPFTSTQGGYARHANFVGTGVTCAGNNCVGQGGAILGYGQATKSSTTKSFNLDGVVADADFCWDVNQAGEGYTEKLQGLVCRPYATSSVGASGTVPGNGKISLGNFTDNGSGELQGHFSSTCSGTNCPLNTYTGWMINPTAAQSAQGGWTLHNVTSTTFDLQGSDSSYLSGKTVSANIVSGSNMITLNVAMSTQVKATQSVTGSCISGTAKILAVEVTYSVLFLDQNVSCTATENIVIADSAGGSLIVDSVGIAVGGTGYAVGDSGVLVGGTLAGGGNAAAFIVTEIDGGAGTGIGVVTGLDITDGGSYTALPGAGAATTTDGSGSGLTVTVSAGAQLVLSFNQRTGPCFQFGVTNAVQIDNFQCQAHAIGALLKSGTTRVFASHCKFDDENFLQDDTRVGIKFTGSARRNTFDQCGIYYSNHRVVDETTSGGIGNANAVTNSNISTPAGSGLNSTTLEITASTPGTPKNKGFIFSANTSGQPMTAFISNDAYSVSVTDTQMPRLKWYYQGAAAIAAMTGCGNGSLTKEVWECIGTAVPRMFANDNTAHTVPADTTEDTLATVTLPANTLGANGCLVLRTTWSETASTNAKTMRAYLGGTGGAKFMENAVVSSTAMASMRYDTFCNRNATNSQIGGILDAIFGNSASSVPTGAIDTTASQTIVITGQKASSGELLRLEQYSILLEPHP